MNYPTPQRLARAVANKSHIQLACWVRFLPSPATEFEAGLLQVIMAALGDLGGITPAISKHIGWADGYAGQAPKEHTPW